MTEEGIKIVVILTMAFSLAFVFGFLAQKVKLSPILGYLLAGYIIGPFSPGFVADPVIAEQLSDVGIILLMFGVGLHFSWDDLMRVKSIAIPGAVGQISVATILGAIVCVATGYTLGAGLVIGMAISVASTAVLVRMLSDNHLLTTSQGHIAVGWLIVEDIATVLILILLPQLAEFNEGINSSFYGLLKSIAIIISKLALLGLSIYYVVHTLAKHILLSASRTRSFELLTLALLSIIFAVTTGAAYLFGVSLALGAFLSGMVVKRTDISHQAAAITLPMKDAFAAIFFISVGMLFNPGIILKHIPLFTGLLIIILLAKPITAFFIVRFYNYSFKTAFIVGIALAQIGEFSFILAEEAWKLQILPDDGFDLLVACALVSIAINPLMFKLSNTLEYYARKYTSKQINSTSPKEKYYPRAIVVGFGPIGREVAKLLHDHHVTPVIIDHNVDAISEVKNRGWEGVYGDASYPNILDSAQVDNANWLIITVPDLPNTLAIIQAVRQVHSEIKIIARTQYLSDMEELKEIGITSICSEKETLRVFHDTIRFMVKRGLIA